jgi:hypothetical protein
MTLEGMEDPEGMRDFLYSRMRGTRGEKAGTDVDPLATVLHEIAGELREIRTLVEKVALHDDHPVGERRSPEIGSRARRAARSRGNRRIGTCV